MSWRKMSSRTLQTVMMAHRRYAKCTQTQATTQTIRSYLRARMIEDCTIPCKKKRSDGKSHNGKGRRDAVRYVVERFFSWLKNGFVCLRIRYERRSENYLSCICQHRVTCDVFQSIGISSTLLSPKTS